MKPILHVIFHPDNSTDCNHMKRIADAIKKIFGKDYKLLFTGDRIEVVADNSTVVNLNLGSIEDLSSIVERLEQIAEDCKEADNDSQGFSGTMDWYYFW